MATAAHGQPQGIPRPAPYSQAPAPSPAPISATPYYYSQPPTTVLTQATPSNPLLPGVQTSMPPLSTSEANVGENPPSAANIPLTTSVATQIPIQSVGPSTGPSYTFPGNDGGSGLGDTYKMYTGSGEVSAGWPSESSWGSFDSLWAANFPTLSISCSQFNVQDNTNSESSDLKSAIQSISSSTGVDPRFILAIIMQESRGCVRAPTTQYSVKNPGLRQSYEGSGTCNSGTAAASQGVTPCPSSEIGQMVKNGVEGTVSGGMSLVGAMQQAGCQDVSKYYKAARIYNSGSVTGNNLSLGVATRCYASDIATRLTGWTSGASACTLG